LNKREELDALATADVRVAKTLSAEEMVSTFVACTIVLYLLLFQTQKQFFWNLAQMLLFPAKKYYCLLNHNKSI
jgi:hypothetical protein